jgi:hypothetical protein
MPTKFSWAACAGKQWGLANGRGNPFVIMLNDMDQLCRWKLRDWDMGDCHVFAFVVFKDIKMVDLVMKEW